MDNLRRTANTKGLVFATLPAIAIAFMLGCCGPMPRPMETKEPPLLDEGVDAKVAKPEAKSERKEPKRFVFKEIVPPLTYEQYKALEIGMGRADVERLLGRGGIELASSGEHKVVQYKNPGFSSANIVVGYRQGLLETKAQAGLR